MKRMLIVAAMAALLCGCMTTYELTKPDGTHFRVASFREFPGGVKVDYTSPQGASLKVEAGQVQTADPLSPLVPVVVEILKAKAVTPP